MLYHKAAEIINCSHVHELTELMYPELASVTCDAIPLTQSYSLAHCGIIAVWTLRLPMTELRFSN